MYTAIKMRCGFRIGSLHEIQDLGVKIDHAGSLEIHARKIFEIFDAFQGVCRIHTGTVFIRII
jgi:hypothetical protein